MASRLFAITLVALAVAFVMSPAAYHRHTGPREVTESFVRVSTRLLLLGMWPLAIGICLDFYFVSRVILNAGAARWLATGLLVAFVGLWFMLPPHPTSSGENAFWVDASGVNGSLMDAYNTVLPHLHSSGRSVHEVAHVRIAPPHSCDCSGEVGSPNPTEVQLSWYLDFASLRALWVTHCRLAPWHLAGQSHYIYRETAMPDEPRLREQAREAVRSGKLPSRSPDPTWGGPGVGARCATSP